VNAVLDELTWRGFIAHSTDPDALRAHFDAGPVTFYVGFDPTAPSIHMGNLVQLMLVRLLQAAGHRPILLVGGSTGLIGDPKQASERSMNPKELVAEWVERIRTQVAKFVEFDGDAGATLVNNYDWTAQLSTLDFLRDVGKHFSVNQMVAKESVRARMQDRDAGISYTEFSYMLLQAFDFYVLCRDYQCELQIGGRDQWGNITAGIDFTRKKLARTVFGLTLPLITNADGSKFGKTVAGAVWLDPARTSVYRFYQFWIRADDRDVIRYLKYFTFLSRDEIAALEQQHTANPGARAAHQALARSVTELIHGPDATAEAIRASQILFGGDLAGISAAVFNEIVGEVPSRPLNRRELEGPGKPLVELFVLSGLAPSKGQARKDIEAGGAYLNNRRATNPLHPVTTADLLFNRHLLLRKGKRNYVVLSAA